MRRALSAAAIAWAVLTALHQVVLDSMELGLVRPVPAEDLGL